MADSDKSFNQRLIEEFRANDGKVGGQFEGRPLLILTTTGAKSGLPREIPLVHDRDGERLVVIASKGGAPTNPDWYHNVVANPDVTVELPGESFQGTAVPATGEERDRLFGLMAQKMPGFADYQRTVDRTIPVVVIERAA